VAVLPDPCYPLETRTTPVFFRWHIPIALEARRLGGWLSGYTTTPISPSVSALTPTSSITFNVNPANGPVNQLQGSNYGYDLDGNQTLLSPFTLGYDAENRQTTVTSPLNGSAAYAYDGDGRWVTKALNGGSPTIYVYDASGDMAAEYGTSTDSATGTQYLTADALGTTRLITDASKSVKNCYDYLPFGEELLAGAGGRASACFSSSPDKLNVKFTGKERDSESGLDFFNARYMSSAQGRFTSPDPDGGQLANPQSLNRYTYTLNNPLSYTDLTGLYVCRDTKDGSCTSDQDVKFEKALDALRSQDGDVGRAAAAYGTAGVANGVTVGFADLSKKGEGGNTVSTIGTDANGSLQANSDVTINSKIDGDSFAAAIGHEGSHAADAQDVVRSGLTEDGQGNPRWHEYHAVSIRNAGLGRDK
jgi:RHS repeat-associated protein